VDDGLAHPARPRKERFRIGLEPSAAPAPKAPPADSPCRRRNRSLVGAHVALERGRGQRWMGGPGRLARRRAPTRIERSSAEALPPRGVRRVAERIGNEHGGGRRARMADEAIGGADGPMPGRSSGRPSAVALQHVGGRSPFFQSPSLAPSVDPVSCAGPGGRHSFSIGRSVVSPMAAVDLHALIGRPERHLVGVIFATHRRPPRPRPRLCSSRGPRPCRPGRPRPPAAR